MFEAFEYPLFFLFTLLIQKLSLPLHSRKAFFSIMQNKTDKGTSLVSKSLAV